MYSILSFPGLVSKCSRQMAPERDAPGRGHGQPGPNARRTADDRCSHAAPPPPPQCQRAERAERSGQHGRPVLDAGPRGDAQHDVRRAVLTQSDDQEHDPLECDKAVAQSVAGG